ncbi:MAG: hypothetical protein L3J39_09555 [Verrucomicrobiales bacterium]|nr:hypothetical protein [Verrucomicrobiales bacterium]
MESENKEESLRKNLGNFSSIICLKALIVGLEDVLGEKGARANLVLAGRHRGRDIVKSLGYSKTDSPLEEWTSAVKAAIGETGTRLCEIDKVEPDGETIRIYLSETVCSSGEEVGSSRQLTFTLGAIWGAVEEALDKKFIGKQTGSILRGQDYDIVELQER